MKDDMNDLIDSLFPGIDNSKYSEFIKKSSENTQKAWDMLSKTGNITDINAELHRQSDELRKMAEQLNSDNKSISETLDTIETEANAPVKVAINRSIPHEQITVIFDEIKKRLSDVIIGQDEFLSNLILAFKRPFAIGNASNGALNNIVAAGSDGTGKTTSIDLITKLMKEYELIDDDTVTYVNMALYPSQDETDLFLSDLYIALSSKSKVIVLESPQKAHPALIMMASELIQKGKINLSNRYIEQKGVLVEVNKALTKSAISTLEANEKYLIVLADTTPRKLSEAFGNGFNEAVSDFCETKAFDEASVQKIATLKLNELTEEIRSTLGVEMLIEEGIVSRFQKSFDIVNNVHSMEKYKDEMIRAISEYKLRNDIAPGKEIILSFDEDEIMIETVDAADSRGKLTDYLPKQDTTELEQVKKELSEIVGLKAVKEYVLSLEDNFKVQARRKAQGMKSQSTSMHMIFTGNPGTGKTTVARIVAKYLKAVGILSSGQLVEVTRADLVGRYVGHTAPLTTSVIKSALGGVLFIDEAYALYRAENDSFGLEAIDTIVKCMEEYRDDMVFILAGYTKEMEEFLTANSGLKSRFPNIIEFPDYTGEELTAIAVSIAKSKGYVIADGVEEAMTKYFNTVQAFNSRQAGNGRLARNKVEQAILNQSKRIVSDENAPLDVLVEEDFDFVSMPV